jgi:hypothetical protein
MLDILAPKLGKGYVLLHKGISTCSFGSFEDNFHIFRRLCIRDELIRGVSVSFLMIGSAL